MPSILEIVLHPWYLTVKKGEQMELKFRRITYLAGEAGLEQD